MKLLTHNMLMCNRKGCTIEHFPMKIEPTKLAVHESEFNPDFILNVLPKIDWNALVSGAKDVKTNRTHACASTLRVIQLTALLFLFLVWSNHSCPASNSRKPCRPELPQVNPRHPP